MLQVRAGHCPNCKETVPPGADYCPVCGEDLNWQTVAGKKISSRGASGRNGARDLVRNLIFLATFSLLVVLAFILFQRMEQKPPTKKPASNAVTTKPKAGSTPASTDDANSMLDNALSDGDNTATNSVDNSVSNSVDNSVSNNVSTPESRVAPKSAATPKPTNVDDLSDIENQ